MSEVAERKKFYIRGVPATAVPLMWHNCEAFIKRALDHSNGCMTAKDVREFCEDRTMQLWLIADEKRIVAAATTEIINYPQFRACRVITLAGKYIDDWAEELDNVLMEWAAEQGCHTMEALVRRGFVKRLEKHGYVPKYNVVCKDIRV